MRSSSDKQARNRRAIGSRYEQKAAEFLIQHGYSIIERNWQAGHKEIDLIARKPGQIVFVEVKGSRSNAFGHPAEWVGPRKQQKLIEAAQIYLERNRITGQDVRFDVICFMNGVLEYFPSAFDAPQG
ncbi:MAG: YraN family protein [candidate division Zixibacteria bacterium]|nr:YraN family protein [candidate division Zixibacteria bacterium]